LPQYPPPFLENIDDFPPRLQFERPIDNLTLAPQPSTIEHQESSIQHRESSIINRQSSINPLRLLPQPLPHHPNKTNENNASTIRRFRNSQQQKCLDIPPNNPRPQQAATVRERVTHEEY